MPSQFDKEKTKKNISLILDKVKTEADPEALNNYRSLFKKEVSLFRRSWAAAYLLMLYDQGALGRGDRNQSRKFDSRPQGSRERPGENRVSGRTAQEGRTYPLAEEDSRRLFLSIGRNRRVFPREILGLINTKTAIPREDIGAIRILDNYSFVQVRSTVADTIIEALNGQMFRGRTLAVNYARARRDEGEPRPPDFDETDSGDDTPEENYRENDIADSDSVGSDTAETGFDEGAYTDTEDQNEDRPNGLSDQGDDHSDKENV
ncbi:MAG: DbpA RNA binding domain-containing protein [Treponema sp.]|jgi:hypothetical protein|nr:DbpA RNA binding domain-containing protein [Treponema sp.]